MDNDPKGHHQKPNMNSLKVNGFSTSAAASPFVSSLSTAVAPAIEGGGTSRLNIPTQTQICDPLRMGLFTEDGVGYRWTLVVRSYEVGPDKTATLETILNLLQVSTLLGSHSHENNRSPLT